MRYSLGEVILLWNYVFFMLKHFLIRVLHVNERLFLKKQNTLVLKTQHFNGNLKSQCVCSSVSYCYGKVTCAKSMHNSEEKM